MKSTTISGIDGTDRTRESIKLLVVGLFFFSFQDMIMKYFSDSYSVLQLVLIRTIIALIVMLIIAMFMGGMQSIIAKQPKLLLIKGGVTFISYLSYYLAIASLPISDVVAIAFCAPIIMTLISIVFLKEQVGARRIMAMVVAFFSVLLVVGPSGNFSDLGALLAFICAISYSISALITRFIDQGDQPITIGIYSMIAFFIMTLLVSLIIALFDKQIPAHPSIAFLLREWSMPGFKDANLMLILGIIAAIGFYCMGRAYLIAPASHVAPFEYSYIIWAVLFAYLFFGEIPKLTSMLGVVILISSSIYIWYRDTHVPDTPTISFDPNEPISSHP